MLNLFQHLVGIKRDPETILKLVQDDKVRDDRSDNGDTVFWVVELNI